jgi:hypothetical protein
LDIVHSPKQASPKALEPNVATAQPLGPLSIVPLSIVPLSMVEPEPAMLPEPALPPSGLGSTLESGFDPLSVPSIGSRPPLRPPLPVEASAPESRAGS